MTVLAKVGSFTKRTTGTGSQAITGVGFQGKALLLWTTGGTASGTPRTGALIAFGMSGDSGGTITSRAIAGASQDGSTSSNASRRIASKAITLVQWAESLQAEADLSSFDSDGFTLNWTTNNATGYIIHYLVLGGTDLTAAKAIDWTKPNATTGNQSVTGVGFQPTAALFGHIGNVGGTFASNTSLVFGLGASDGSLNQWLISETSLDAQATMDTQRAHRPDNVIGNIDNSTLTLTNRASVASFDADGFTLNWSRAGSGAAPHIALLLAGVTAKAGTISKPIGSAPQVQAVDGIGIAPAVVLLASAQATGLLTGEGAAHSRIGIGASDGTSHQAAAMSDTNALADASVDAVDRTDAAFVVMDNDTATEDARATATMDATGFTLTWNPNHATATDISYLAFGTPVTGYAHSQAVIVG